MALIRCGECGREVSDKAAACPGCGAPVPDTAGRAIAGLQAEKDAGPAPSGFRLFVWVVLAIVGAGLIFVLLQSLDRTNQTPEAIAARKEADEKYLMGEAITVCEKEYAAMNADRKYLPSDLRFKAGVWDRLRQDYRDRWHVDP